MLRHNRLSQCSRAAGAILTLALFGSSRAVADLEPEDRFNGPYCGVYCVYGALSALDKPVDFESLLHPRYMGSIEGSSVGELRRAVVDAGGYAVAMSGLSLESLRHTRHPMILHVASDGQPNQYDHWVLFLGMDGDKARIVDPPSDPDSVPLADVLARWDGTALFVADRPISVATVTAREIWARSLYLLLALGSLILVYFGRPRFCENLRRASSIRIASSQGATLVVLSIGFAIAIHATDAAGFLRNPAATSYVAAANIAKFFPKLSLAEARRFQSRKEGIIVNARFRQSFAAGHIDGAINVPIDATTAERRRLLTGVSRETPILVYCQSLPCDFDERVGTLLARDGFQTIRLFPGGWEEWTDGKRHSR